MQISDLLQSQAAAGKPVQASPEAARPGEASGVPAVAAAETFGVQLRRAIQRQASAAVTERTADGRPEPAVGAADLEGLDPQELAHAGQGGVPEAASRVEATHTAGDTTSWAASVASDIGAALPPASLGVAPTLPGAVPDAVAGGALAALAAAGAGRPSAEPAVTAPFQASTAVGRVDASAGRVRVAPAPAAPSLRAEGASNRPQGQGLRSGPIDGARSEGAELVTVDPLRLVHSPQTDERAGRPGSTLGPRDLTSAGKVAAVPPPLLVTAADLARDRVGQHATSHPASDASLAEGTPMAEVPGAVRSAVDDLGAQSTGAASVTERAAPSVRAPLKSTPLGPRMDLIVGDAPDPEVVAVLAYARDSGYSEQALHRLFGHDPSTAAASAGPRTSEALAASNAETPRATVTRFAPELTQAAVRTFERPRLSDMPAGSAGGQPSPVEMFDDITSPLPLAQKGRLLPPATVGSQTGAAGPTGQVPAWSVTAWMGGRGGISPPGARVPAATLPASVPGAVPDRVDGVSVPTLRTPGMEPISSPAGGAAVSVAPGAPAIAAPAAVPLATPAGVHPTHAALAHRLAEATATRMVAELRQGNGRLRLQIEPASLGKVDIDMSMRQGSLEATLVAHQVVTRDLLADGLPRLRDTLAQLGMNVAALDIRSGLNGQSDGKSTNQQNRDFWYSARRATADVSTSPVDGGDQRRNSRLDLWA